MFFTIFICSRVSIIALIFVQRSLSPRIKSESFQHYLGQVYSTSATFGKSFWSRPRSPKSGPNIIQMIANKFSKTIDLDASVTTTLTKAGLSYFPNIQPTFNVATNLKLDATRKHKMYRSVFHLSDHVVVTLNVAKTTFSFPVQTGSKAWVTSAQ